MTAKDPTVTRALLARMLEHGGLKKGPQGYEVEEGVVLDLLLRAGSGPAPLAKVDGLELDEDFLIARTAESRYYLPYGALIGLKVTTRGEKATARAGFLR